MPDGGAFALTLVLIILEIVQKRGELAVTRKNSVRQVAVLPSLYLFEIGRGFRGQFALQVDENIF
jgi:hypothetical protein